MKLLSNTIPTQVGQFIADKFTRTTRITWALFWRSVCMNYGNHLVLILMLTLASAELSAIEETIYDLNGSEPVEKILDKLGVSNASKFPVEVKKQNYTLQVSYQKGPEKILSLSFNPAHSFTLNSKDVFEKIESRKSHDIIRDELIVSDPKSGRIFHLNNELKVYKLDVVNPWNSKEKLKPLKDIIAELDSNSIVLKTKKKKETKK